MYNDILAFMIYVFHSMIVAFVILGWMSMDPMVVLLHFTWCITLVFHWYMNNDICSLSLLEGSIRGINYKQSFVARFISPLYNISNTCAEKICWIITSIGIILSGYKLYKFYHDNKENVNVK